MKIKQNVLEIQKTLGLSDAFHRVDLNKHEIESIETFLEPFLDGCQNNSPSLGDLIKLSKKYNGILECYIVNTDREDTRLSCEGICFTKLSPKDLAFLVNEYNGADEMTVDNNDDGTFYLRLWWD